MIAVELRVDAVHEYAEVIDGGDYSVPGQQSLPMTRWKTVFS